MKNKFLFLILGLLLISSVSALDCWGTFKQNTYIELIQKCPTCSYVNITSITYPNGTIFLNEEMQQEGINFNYTLADSSQLGVISYGTIGDKNGASPPNYEDLCIEITASGEILETSKALIDIALLLFFIGLLVGFYHVREKVNFEKWHNGILNRYEDKNYVKMVLSGITFNLMKNSFIIYYLIGFLIMSTVTSLAWSYNIIALIDIMKVLMYIYGWSFLLVGVVFLSYVQEWTMDLIEQITKMDWGFDE